MVTKNFFDHINHTDPKIEGPNTRMHYAATRVSGCRKISPGTSLIAGRPLTYTQFADKTIHELSTSSEHNKHLLDPDLERLGCGVIFESNTTDSRRHIFPSDTGLGRTGMEARDRKSVNNRN